MAVKKMDDITLRLAEVATFLGRVIDHNLEVAKGLAQGKNWKEETIVPYLQSQPGVGKTSICWQVAKEKDVDFLGFIPAQYDPAELAGFNFFDPATRETWRAKPEFLPSTGRWLVLADEFGQATMMQKNIMAQLIQERRLGAHNLSPEATVVLAGNRQIDRAGVQPDPSHVLDRVLVINVVAHLEDWIEWALTNEIRPEVIAYLRYRSSWFEEFDPARKKNTTPRGWAKTSTLLNMNFPSSIELAAIAGQIGTGAATDFHGFLRVYRDLPDPDAVLANPTKHPLPKMTDNPNALYALCGALANRADQNNIAAVLKVVERLPAEFAVMLMTDACTRDRSLHKNKLVIGWKVTQGAATLVT